MAKISFSPLTLLFTSAGFSLNF